MSSQTSMDEVYFALCKSTDTPVALGLWLRYKHAPKELLEVKLDPGHYTDSASFAKDYMLISVIRKYKGLKTEIDTEYEAISKFITSEEQCLSTNRRILESLRSVTPGRVEGIIHSAKRKIARILGSFHLRKVLHQCEWTTGSTLEIPRRKSFVDTKLTQLPITVTPRAAVHLAREIVHDGRWFEALSGVYPEGPFCLHKSVLQIVDGNKITTVPKDSSTDRVIAIEPRGNIFLQKGVGNYLRGRLKRSGVDLSKQEVNQYWAAEALSLDLATVDLSSASDTIARELIYLLLPVDWAVYLDEIRSPFGRLPNGRVIKYEKFSSMGNGFTFELESMIFFALSEAIQDTSGRIDWKLTSVYGDDIILPKAYYHDLAEYFPWFGFSVNNRKSYYSGQFYESCGKHYFGSDDVTPIYQKELLDEVEAMRLGNRLQRWVPRTNSPFSIVRDAWQVLRSRYTTLKDCQIPLDVEGDDGWVSPVLSNRKYCPNRGLRCRVIRFTKKGLPFDDKAMLAYALRKLAWRSNSMYVRKDVTASLSDVLSDRLGYLSVIVSGNTTEFEVESGRFTYGWRWVHTNEVVRS